MSVAMSNPSSQPGIYKIFCVLNDEKDIFLVKISKGDTVAELTERIMEKNKNRFRTVDVHELKLYQADIPDDGNLMENAAERMSKKPSPFSGTTPLSVLYKDTPQKKTVHIIVQSPPSGEFIQENLAW